MKKSIKIISLVFMLLSTTISHAYEEVSVMLDGKQLDFDVPPQVINDRAMVPMRKLFETMGISVSWDENTQTITSKKNNKQVVMTLGDLLMKVDKRSVYLDAAPCEINNRTLVPIRALTEAYGFDVTWYEDTNTISILSPNIHPRAYDKFKNYLIRYGEPNDSLPEYTIFYIDNSSPFSALFTHIYMDGFTKNSLYLCYDYDDVNSYSLLITIDNENSPDIYFAFKKSNVKKYHIYGHFPDPCMKYKVESSNASEYSDETAAAFDNMVNVLLNALNSILKNKIGMNLDDFGIYFEPIDF